MRGGRAVIVASADDLRMATAGQWLGGTPASTLAPARPGAAAIPVPFMVQGVGTDTRGDLRGRMFIALRGEAHDGHQHLAAAVRAGAIAALVDRKSQGVPRPDGLPLLEVADTRVALGDLARWWRSRLRGRVVAITGSSGKTTTRRMVHAALGATMRGTESPKSFNNDIGVPLTLLGASSDDGYLVCEIGMSHAGEIAPLARMAAPQVAIITMVGRAHIGGLGSVAAIIAEKVSVLDGLHTSGVAIVQGDQPDLVAAATARAKPGVRVVTFGSGAANQWQLMGRTLLACDAAGARAAPTAIPPHATPADSARAAAAQVIRVREPDGTEWECALGMPGAYNAMNALAAIAAARMLGVSAADIARALPAVAPEAMRMERQVVGDVAVYNDAYNANPDAMLASLGAFIELTGGAVPVARRVTVLGDMLELGAAETIAALHAEVGRAVALAGPAVAVFVGEGSRHGASAARAAAPGAPPMQVVHVPALDEAGAAAIARLLQAGDVLLLKGSRGSGMERLLDTLKGRAVCAGTAACSTT